MTDRVDMAVVNVPLSKRGDLAAKARKSVLEEAAKREAKAKADRKAHRALITEAHGLIAKVPADRMKELGASQGLTAGQAREEFKRAAWRMPEAVIKAMKREIEA